MLPALRRRRGRETALSPFQTMMEDFFSDPFFRLTDRDISGRMWPRVDIRETENDYQIKADLPGVDKKDIDISVEGDVLSISGDKKEESEEKEDTYAHFERSYGSFCRSFTLPSHVDSENIDARFKDGVLYIGLKKTGQPESKAKKIEVK